MFLCNKSHVSKRKGVLAAVLLSLDVYFYIQYLYDLESLYLFVYSFFTVSNWKITLVSFGWHFVFVPGFIGYVDTTIIALGRLHVIVFLMSK